MLINVNSGFFHNEQKKNLAIFFRILKLSTRLPSSYDSDLGPFFRILQLCTHLPSSYYSDLGPFFSKQSAILRWLFLHVSQTFFVLHYCRWPRVLLFSECLFLRCFSSFVWTCGCICYPCWLLGLPFQFSGYKSVYVCITMIKQSTTKPYAYFLDIQHIEMPSSYVFFYSNDDIVHKYH